MNLTVGDLRRYIKDIPDDYEIWIEYPARYGLATPIVIDQYVAQDIGENDCDLIKATTTGYDHNKKKFYICHHY